MKPMSNIERLAIAFALLWMPPILASFCIFNFLGWPVENWQPQPTILYAGAVFLIWLGIYAAKGFTIVEQQRYLVLERLGKFCRVAHAGPHILLFPPFIDRTLQKDGVGTLEYQQRPLFGETGEEIDFTDDSAPVIATSSFRIGRPGGRRSELNRHIAAFAYSFTLPVMRVRVIIDGAVRSELQRYTVDAAQLAKSNIVIAATNGVRAALEAIGVFLEPNQGIVIDDIDLPQATIELRRKRLQGQTQADLEVAQATGFFNQIKVMVEGAKHAGITMTPTEAWEIIKQKGFFDVLGRTGSNISFVVPDANGLFRTVTVANVTNGEKL